MKVNFEIKGLDKVIASLISIPNAFTEIMGKELNYQLTQIEKIARTKHNYQTISGKLENTGLQKEISDDGLSGVIWVDKENGAPYAWRIHEGFAGKTDKIGRTFSKPKADQFLYNAFNIRKDILINGIKRALKRVTKKAGF